MKSTYYATIADSKNVLVPDKSGCTNLVSMAISGNTLYCIKVNSQKNKACLYQYTGAGTVWTSKTTKLLDTEVHGATGMTYYEAETSSSVDKALFIACNNSAAGGRKFVKLKLDGTLVRAFNSVTGTTYTGRFGAITAYRDKEFIVMANGLNTEDKICLMRGQFNKSTESFEVEETFYVKNLGYQSTQDIYYHNTLGLFILSCAKDESMCKNFILQVDYDGLFRAKPTNSFVYEPIDRIGILKSRSTFNKYMISSMSVDQNNQFVTVGNIEKLNGSSIDAIQCLSNFTV